MPLLATQNLVVSLIDPNMATYTGNAIYVRETVIEKLGEVSTKLSNLDDNLALEVVYGYRALSIQTALFEKFHDELSAQYSGADLMEAVHRLVAVTDVAGHPTGGAVDVQLLKSGSPLSMGTKIWEFVSDAYTFSPYVSREGWFN